MAAGLLTKLIALCGALFLVLCILHALDGAVAQAFRDALIHLECNWPALVESLLSLHCTELVCGQHRERLVIAVPLVPDVVTAFCTHVIAGGAAILLFVIWSFLCANLKQRNEPTAVHAPLARASNRKRVA